ncbi:TPA: helix-turn-helix transcriptional regulator [Stenotrophomonas maltophilia]|uniref:helix-turn-helix domain-containing protein n=1 Tax=Stenotrophomonas maltophilia TaxID=40324 RepID=UPI0021DA3B1D|nr:helix-turn-helix transcriptional regulator [Stenotrophomonas maltophilia]UXY49878.1 helix-turn-helix transcriptional regulator [Stenotrophomonas maltophilia]HEL7629277.1 helix-turn-helix transcriptional regulator [Stenotrophomonas maltophilia]
MNTANELWVNRQEESEEARREYERERLQLWTLDSIAEMMEAAGITKADVARTLGTSRSHVSQVFSGARNATLATISDLAWACGKRAVVKFEPLRFGQFIPAPVRPHALNTVIPLRQKTQWKDDLNPLGQREARAGAMW